MISAGSMYLLTSLVKILVAYGITLLEWWAKYPSTPLIITAINDLRINQLNLRTSFNFM